MIIDFPRQEHIPGLKALWKEAFEDTDAFVDSFFETGFSLYRCRCIREGSRVLAALYWFDCRWQDKRLAYIYGVATAKNHRGQGLCRKLMETTQQILLQLGYSGVVLVPATRELFSFYKNMGYACFGGIRQWQTAAANPIPLTELGYKEYAAARKALLPPDSVIQEGALLRFLGSFARFYQGENCLFCCAEDGGKLMIYELLGDTDQACGICAALGHETATLRTPGSEPFAMYLSLAEDGDFPGYFAFALD